MKKHSNGNMSYKRVRMYREAATGSATVWSSGDSSALLNFLKTNHQIPRYIIGCVLCLAVTYMHENMVYRVPNTKSCFQKHAKSLCTQCLHIAKICNNTYFIIIRQKFMQ